MAAAPWAQYAEYDLEPTVAARLTMAKRYRAELLKAIDGSYKADGFEVNPVQLRLTAADVLKDIRRYEGASRRSRIVPLGRPC